VLSARDGDRLVATLTPEKRFFAVQQTTTTEAAIHTTFFADLYAVLGDPAAPGRDSEKVSADESRASLDGGQGWVIRLYHNPLVPWIWLGAALMAFGGIVSLTDRRHRVGAPTRSGQTHSGERKRAGQAGAAA
jgi:cytochrome c-type biogenesis protein CcmF